MVEVSPGKGPPWAVVEVSRNGRLFVEGATGSQYWVEGSALVNCAG